MSEAFLALAEYAEAIGAAPLNQHPACWERDIDERWGVALNAHPEQHEAKGVSVPPFHAAIFWRGWYVGLLTPYGGAIAAHPDGALEDRFIADVRAAIVRDFPGAAR